jgi:hypothetical protein
MIYLYIFLIFVILIVLIACSSIIYEHIIKKYYIGIMYFKSLYHLLSLGINRTKYVRDIDFNDNKHVVIKFKENEKHKCDICYLDLTEITNNIMIEDKEKNIIFNDYLMTFKCCKYTKKICKKCFLIDFYNKFNINCRSLFSNLECNFCKQQVYILQLETEYIKILVNN